MPGEFEPQDHVFMIWPQRADNWRFGAKPAQKAFANVAIAIIKNPLPPTQAEGRG